MDFPLEPLDFLSLPTHRLLLNQELKAPWDRGCRPEKSVRSNFGEIFGLADNDIDVFSSPAG